jgi:hypothetical protein
MGHPPALNLAPSVGPESLAHFVFAAMHVISALLSSGQWSQNDSGFQPCPWLNPRTFPVDGVNTLRGGLVKGGASRKLNRRWANLSRRDPASLE